MLVKPELSAIDTVAIAAMEFPERLAVLRRQKGMTGQALADAVGIHVTQLRRYEGGKSQPTLDVLRKLAVALGVSADLLLFDSGERDPDEDMRLQFEAARRLDPDEKESLKTVIDGVITRHEVRRLASNPST
jgi:transcriptional regulator with XRE-family HTH domain